MNFYAVAFYDDNKNIVFFSLFKLMVFFINWLHDELMKIKIIVMTLSHCVCVRFDYFFLLYAILLNIEIYFYAFIFQFFIVHKMLNLIKFILR